MHIHSNQHVGAIIAKGITKGHVTYLCADNVDTFVSIRNWYVILRSFSHRSTSLIASS
jgi:hypothetical protein